jgi:hypothetical protein
MAIEFATNPGEVRDWIFTFGFNHYDGEVALRNRFVRIHGTFAGARTEMVARFGLKWAFQYKSEEDAGVADYHLVEYSPAVPA